MATIPTISLRTHPIAYHKLLPFNEIYKLNAIIITVYRLIVNPSSIRSSRELSFWLGLLLNYPQRDWRAFFKDSSCFAFELPVRSKCMYLIKPHLSSTFNLRSNHIFVELICGVTTSSSSNSGQLTSTRLKWNTTNYIWITFVSLAY